MHNEGEEIHVSTTEARGGATTGAMRYVLGISLAAVVLIFIAILILNG